MKAFEADSENEKLFAAQLVKNSFEKRTETFHIRLSGASTGLCLGANGQIGETGKASLPRVLLDWGWDSIGLDTCNFGNEEFVYCDATQLTKQVVKRLAKARETTSQKDFEVAELLSFKAFLIKDGYSRNFLTAFDKFAKEEFLPMQEYATDWSKFVSDETKFSYKSQNGSVEPLPATGLYQVTIVPHFREGKAWQFFEQNQPIGSIEVFLELEEQTVQTNPFYFLPIDAQVGETKETQVPALERPNFGTSYQGNILKIAPETELSFEVQTLPTAGSGVVSMTTVFENSFEKLNKGEKRGTILSIEKTGENYSMEFAPSIATPILMEIIERNRIAEGFFELREGDSIVPIQQYYSLWSGAGSSIENCSDFAGRPLPFKQPDNPATSASCRLVDKASKNESFGFHWTNALPGRVFLKTIFYTPNANYKIRNACTTDSLLVSPTESRAEGFLDLSFGSNQQILSLKNLFELVLEEKVCVGEEGEKINFWWNESFLENELQKNYQNYFERLAQEENFTACSVG
ncbi:MAG: hypothetical protein HYW50_00150, partial [Candidatus Diapherotrites archaeon]|nr:hypothetical protein [Candidatus Diapherotrites archaeon]